MAIEKPEYKYQKSEYILCVLDVPEIFILVHDIPSLNSINF
jgi:hypothetical protein